MTESNNRYEFEFIGGKQNLYLFVTDGEVRYEIKFIPSTDFFGAYPELDVDIFEMTISVADNPAGKRLPADPLVALTIFAIFEHFFLPHRQAVIFICDSSDGREQARFRKFGAWFYNKTSSLTDLTKVDRVAIDGNDKILLSLIISRLHPQLMRVVAMFMQLGEEDK